MTLNKALSMVEEEYKKAKKQERIRKPLAYALYQVWHKQEREERERVIK